MLHLADRLGFALRLEDRRLPLRLGAQQNRAEHTADSLSNSILQTQNSESEIRDLDIALAVMENTKKKILGQSSMFVMAQARQNAMGVMKFLQG